MKLFVLIQLCLIVETFGCWSRSSGKAAPPPTTTTTSTTTTAAPVQDQIPAVNIGETDASAPRRPPSGGKTNSVVTSELRNLSEELYRLDQNSVGTAVNVNLQGKTTATEPNDNAPQPLISSVTPDSLKASTYRTFLNLLDNYIPDVSEPEQNTGPEKSEINSFLNAVVATKVMKKTEEFLKSKGLLKDSLRKELETIWFTPYTRKKNVMGSSGFEHVFLGEIKDGKVSGFHNWLFFEKEEREKDVDYKGYLSTKDLGDKGVLVKMRFDWMNRRKAVGSMFVGTSPELEMALYTICFYARPNGRCNLQMNNQRFSIKVYVQKFGGSTLIGSAYPEFF